MNDRGCNRGDLEDLRWRAGDDPAVAGEIQRAVRIVDDPFETVFRHDDRDPEVMNQAGHGGQDVLGRRRIEGRCGFIQHDDTRMVGEHRADRDPLLLTPRQCAQRTMAQIRDSEQVERLLDPLTHHVRTDGELFHPVGELVFNDVGDEPRERILSDDTDDLCQLARRVGSGAFSVHGHRSRQESAGEVGHQAVDRSEQGRLAGSRGADHDAQLPLGDRQ